MKKVRNFSPKWPKIAINNQEFIKNVMDILKSQKQLYDF